MSDAWKKKRQAWNVHFIPTTKHRPAQFFSSYRGSGSLTENHEVNLTPFLIILQGKWSDPFTGYVLMNLIPYFGASEDRDTGTPGRTRFNFLRPLLRVSRKAQATTGR
jgi:hypothetical protein